MIALILDDAYTLVAARSPIVAALWKHFLEQATANGTHDSYGKTYVISHKKHHNGPFRWAYSPPRECLKISRVFQFSFQFFQNASRDQRGSLCVFIPRSESGGTTEKE